jgi:hypothetical protein
VRFETPDSSVCPIARGTVEFFHNGAPLRCKFQSTGAFLANPHYSIVMHSAPMATHAIAGSCYECALLIRTPNRVRI